MKSAVTVSHPPRYKNSMIFVILGLFQFQSGHFITKLLLSVTYTRFKRCSSVSGLVCFVRLLQNSLLQVSFTHKVGFIFRVSIWFHDQSCTGGNCQVINGASTPTYNQQGISTGQLVVSRLGYILHIVINYQRFVKLT